MTRPKNHAKRNGHSKSVMESAGKMDLPPSVPKTSSKGKRVLITGGAGFIGTNLAHRLLSEGQPVLIFDNLSRPGVERNLAWLQQNHGRLVEVSIGDIQNVDKVNHAVKKASKVFHFAAQVAVTTSLTNPIQDFEINARGTLNLLEGLRALPHPPPILFTSTNKVYGDLHDVKLQTVNGRYEPIDPSLREHGFNESRPLDFHSPYGCSKGCACEYVLDYARTFSIPAVAFHMSCIYGPHQFGNEDQGWVAHFLIQALQDKLITIYGDGRQVRDILFVEDLIDAFLLAHDHIHSLAGQAFNIGGSPANTISLLELLELITPLKGARPQTHFADWRSADQRYYVSDIRSFSRATGWRPKVGVTEGISRLYDWLKANHPLASGPISRTGRQVTGNGEARFHPSSLEGSRSPAGRRSASSRAQPPPVDQGSHRRCATRKPVGID